MSTATTFADAAAVGLYDAIAASHAPLRDAVASYRSAWSELSVSTDLLDVLRAAGGVVLAAEAIAAAGKHVETVARAALAQTLMDTGACSIRTNAHVFSASPARPSVFITDSADVPEHLLHQPPPSPDRAKILRLLKAGEPVPGCTLSNGTHPILTVKAITP